MADEATFKVTGAKAADLYDAANEVAEAFWGSRRYVLTLDASPVVMRGDSQIPVMWEADVRCWFE